MFLRYWLFIGLSFFFFPQPAWAEQVLTVKHYQKQARYEYGAKLLDLALSKLGIPYVIQSPQAQSMNEARGEFQVINGLLDVQWMSTSVHRESKMIPIRIPIFRGVLGLRLLLVTKENRDKIERIHSIRDLRGYIGGHGKHWGDLPVYAANSLKVITNVSYHRLFEQLAIGRFDYFHRGLNEIWEEQARYADRLVVADKLMLFYPHPVYFFVTKKRPELAQLITRGLNLAMEDGSFQQLFLAFHRKIIERGNLDSRRLIVLENPVVPEGTPELDTSWWLPPGLIN